MLIYPEIINLTILNRYSEKVYLDKIDRGKYLFKCNDDYLRVIFEEDNKTIKAIDPSGGPFLSVGDNIVGKFKVVKIYHSLVYQGFIVELTK